MSVYEEEKIVVQVERCVLCTRRWDLVVSFLSSDVTNTAGRSPYNLLMHICHVVVLPTLEEIVVYYNT